MDPLFVENINIAHLRLVDLTRLADQAKPFYDWVETQFQRVLATSQPLEQICMEASKEQLQLGLRHCYDAAGKPDLPLLFDGVGRSYPHTQACYYFFSWMIRDAPKQRLEPLVRRIVQNSGRSRIDIEIDVLASLIYKYRADVKTFTWDVIREIIIDRLEGSRRAIKGHEKETVVRTALLLSVQDFFTTHGDYGNYAKVELSDAQLMIGMESFDVSAVLMDQAGQIARRVLVPIKTRETEGGGHSHLFTRDIMSAINSARASHPDDFLIVVIVAKNWSQREAQAIADKVDHLILFDLSPGEFKAFDSPKQRALNVFIASVLSGTAKPKTSHD
ncbi:MAG: hypothetical protein IT324_05940 [Anaerolineae bacterium]|nr:hypothetical protein [Anaerolineae bacterium]